MLHFIQSRQYTNELDQIELDAEKMDAISRTVERLCAAAVLDDGYAASYGFLVFNHAGGGALMIWYQANGADVTLLTIKPKDP